MSALRFSLHVLGAALIPFLTTMMALWTQAMTDGTRVPLYGYLIALAGGVVAAFIEGARSWPSATPPAPGPLR
jgi:hypothetical protein